MARRWLLLLPLVVAGALSCGRIVVGAITPEHFRFREVVPLDPDPNDPSGWQAVCIKATMSDGNTGATVVCDFEVGVPIRNGQQGYITRRFAQVSAATAANNAARMLLSQHQAGAMLGPICLRFRPLMEVELKLLIAGSKVTKCEMKGLETVTFDGTPTR